jgi:hypothetical protein
MVDEWIAMIQKTISHPSDGMATFYKADQLTE